MVYTSFSELLMTWKCKPQLKVIELFIATEKTTTVVATPIDPEPLMSEASNRTKN